MIKASQKNCQFNLNESFRGFKNHAVPLLLTSLSKKMSQNLEKLETIKCFFEQQLNKQLVLLSLISKLHFIYKIKLHGSIF